MSEDKPEERSDATEDRESIRASQTDRMLYRALPTDLVEGEGSGRTKVSGYMSTVGESSRYEVYEFGERFLESFAPGAFVDTLRNDKISLLFEHQQDTVVGRRFLGKPTKLEEDAYGVRFEAELYDETSYVKDILPALRDGLYGTSIGFRVFPEHDDWEMHPERSANNPEGLPERVIRKAQISEFSIVSNPCNPKATAQVRSITDRYAETMTEQRETAVPNEDESVDEVEDQPAVRADDETCPECGEPIGDPEEHSHEDADRAKTEKTDDESDDKKLAPPFKAEDEDTDDEDRQENTTKEPVEAEADAVTDKPEEPRSKAVAAKKPSEVPSKKKVSYAETIKSRKKTKTNEGISKMENSKMTVSQRSARADEIQERLEELALEFDGNELPEDRAAEWDELTAERAEHTARIEAAEKRREQLAEVAQTAGRTESTRQAPAVHTDKAIHDIYAFRNMDPEDAERRAVDNARRVIDKARFPQSTESREKNQEHVERLLESPYVNKFDAAKWIMRTSEPKYREEYNKWLNHGGMYENRADMALGTDSTGGYMVPFDLDPTWILTSDGAVNPLREVARVEKITGKEFQGVTTAGVTITQDSEGAEVTEGNPALGQLRVNAIRFSAYLPYSYEMEGSSNVAAQLTAALAEAKMEDEASRFATATGDGLTGIEGLVELDDTAGSIIDVAVTGSLSSSDIFALDDDLAPRHRRNASFLAAKPTYNAIRQLDTSGGADLWVRLGGGLPSELIGYQAREMSDMEVQGDSTTNAFIILGDWKKYIIVDRLGMVTKLNPLVVGANGRPTGQSAIVAWYWMGGKFIDDNAFRGLKDLP